MKNWNESVQLVRRLQEVTGTGKHAALATVISVKGSAYRREGAKLLIEEDGSLMGNVSGGCLEGDLRERAMQVLQTGIAAEVTYDTSDDGDALWGLGMGCNGIVRLFLQAIDPFRHRALLQSLAARLDGDQVFAWSTWLQPSDPAGHAVLWDEESTRAASSPEGRPPQCAMHRMETRASGIDEANDARIFTEILVPPPRLVVCGGGEDAAPLATLAALAGFRVTVLDHRAAYLRADLFPGSIQRMQCRSDDAAAVRMFDRGSMVVVKTHHAGHDAGWLERAAASEAAYLGLLGPRERRDALVERLGLSKDPRLFGPVGLDLGATGSEQIAVSVVAEMLAVHAGRRPGHLRDQTGPA